MKFPLLVERYGSRLLIGKPGTVDVIRIPETCKAVKYVEPRPDRQYKEGTVKQFRCLDGQRRDLIPIRYIPPEVKRENWDPDFYIGVHDDWLEYQLVNSPESIIRMGREVKASRKQARTMYLDIEAGSQGGTFPNPKRQRILAVGYAFDNEPVQIMHVNEYRKDEARMLKRFVSMLEEEDPDIIVGYFSKGFDIPYMMERFRQNNIDIRGLSRANSYDAVGQLVKRADKSFMNLIEVNPTLGRIHLDVYQTCVQRDTSLIILRDRKMKTVGEHLGFPGIELDPNEISNLEQVYARNPERVTKYLESDIILTRGITNKYMEGELALADVVKVPLNTIFERYNSLPVSYVLQRSFRDKGLYPVVKNASMYPKLLGFASEGEGSGLGSGKKYRGANVYLRRPGFFKQIHKIDFSSFYPNTIRSFNISPETVHLHSIVNYSHPIKDDGSDETRRKIEAAESFVDSRIITKKEKEYLELTIRDSNIGKQIVLHINQSKVGVTPGEIMSFMNLRKEYKGKMKSAKDKDEESIYNAYQMAFKVLANATYGVLGQKNALAGSIPCAIAVTALCRHMAQRVVDFFDEELIELDTDGLYVTDTRDLTIEQINSFIVDTYHKDFSLPKEKCSLEMEYETFGKAYFYKKKNYVIEKPGKDKPQVSGSSLRSGRYPKVFARAVEIMVRWRIKGDISLREARDSAHDFEHLARNPLTLREYFTGHMRISKTEAEYRGSNTRWIVGMIEDVFRKYGVTLGPGDSIDYFFTTSKNGFAMIDDVLEDMDLLDMTRYHKLVSRVIKVFTMYSNDRNILALMSKQNGKSKHSGTKVKVAQRKDTSRQKVSSPPVEKRGGSNWQFG